MKKYIVCNGNIAQGFRFYGVFDTSEEAHAYGHLAFSESGYTVSELNQAEEYFLNKLEAKQ